MRGNRRMEGFSLAELMIVAVILTFVVGMIGSVVMIAQREYISQHALFEAQTNARAAMDLMLRLVRVAGNDPQEIGFEAIHPDPDGNHLMDSIRLRADWNPGDGALDDPYEDMIFTTSGGSLYVQRPTEDGPIEFVDSIESLSFTYTDSSGSPITHPIAARESIAFVNIELHAPVPGGSDMEFNSSAVVRTRE